MPSVAELIADLLVGAGAGRLFVAPGAGPASLLAAASARGLAPVACPRASAAVAMAAVTGALTERPGVALTGGDPADAAGLALARDSRAPVVLVVPPAPAGEAGAAGGVKGRVRLTPDSAARGTAHALQLALAEPRGAVRLELAEAVAGRAAAPVALALTPPPAAPPDEAALARAAERLVAAVRPLVVAGGDCRRSDAAWLRAFAEAMPAPVLTTPRGKGALPEPHPLAMGVLGGGAPAEPLLERADLLVAVGVDPAELAAAPWATGRPLLSLARASAAAPGAPPEVEVQGEPAAALELLAPRLARPRAADWDVAWLDRVRRRRAPAGGADGALGAARAVALLRELSPAGTIAAVDHGVALAAALAHWAALEPGECLLPARGGEPGLAVASAVAARLACPDREALCVLGGPGLLAGAPELAMAGAAGLPILVLLLDEGAAGATAPDWLGLGRALGLRGWRAGDEPGLRDAVGAARASRGPALVQARLAPAPPRRGV